VDATNGSSSKGTITLFIDNRVMQFEKKYKEGDLLDEIGAELLNDIQHKRVKAKIRWLLSRGEISPDEVQSRADLLMEQPMLPYLTTDDDGADIDPVLQESLSIARELIVGRMAKEGLPPPRGLDNHAKALVDGMPQIRENARLRVEARYRAAADALKGMM
jgi:hypothetical protein